MLQRIFTVLIAVALAVAIVSPHAHGAGPADATVEVVEDLEPDPTVLLSIALDGAHLSARPIAPSPQTRPAHPPATPPPVPPPER